VAVAYAIAAIIGYLVGAVRSASLLEPLLGRDALAEFFGDALKGFVGGGIGWLLAGEAGAYAGLAGTMLGHAFPVFAGFRGGNPVLVFAGGAFVLSPMAAAIALVACGLVMSIASSVAWGVRAGVLAFPLVQLFLAPPGRVLATGALLAIIAAEVAADRLGRQAPHAMPAAPPRPHPVQRPEPEQRRRQAS
jgi:acyl phosphate:glycerol-3-phosphate acyltransferase